MDIRRLPASQGLAWFRQAIDLGAKNPRAVFGAAALAIVALYAAALVMALLANRLTRPLAVLTEAGQQIAAGDYAAARPCTPGMKSRR